MLFVFVFVVAWFCCVCCCFGFVAFVAFVVVLVVVVAAAVVVGVVRLCWFLSCCGACANYRSGYKDAIMFYTRAIEYEKVRTVCWRAEVLLLFLVGCGVCIWWFLCVRVRIC